MQKKSQSPGPGPARHRTASGETGVKPGQHLSSTAISPAAYNYLLPVKAAGLIVILFIYVYANKFQTINRA